MFLSSATDEDSAPVTHRRRSKDNGACICYKSNWLLQQCYSQFKCGSHSTPAKCTQCSCSTCVVWPYYCRRLGSFTLAITSAAGGVQGKFIDLQVPPSSSSIISGWDVRSSRLSNRQPMSPPLHNTWQPGSSMNQIGKIPKKFLCVWSAPVELTTTVKTFSSAWLSSVHDWRLFCFPEPIGHHSTSVTVSVVKFVCTNINLLIYFAQCALLYIVQILWCSCVSGRVLMWMYCGWIYVQFGTAVGLC